MGPEEKVRPCGNPKCSCSTGIHEGSTYGWGRLDSLGFWEFPCRPCAADCDARREETIVSVREHALARGETPKEVEKYLAEAEWIHLPAWPYADTDLAEHTREAQERFQKENQFDDELDELLANEGYYDPAGEEQ